MLDDERVDDGVFQYAGVFPRAGVFGGEEQHGRRVVVRHFNRVAAGKLALRCGREQNVHDLDGHGNEREFHRVAHGHIDGAPDAKAQQMLLEPARPRVQHRRLPGTRLQREERHDLLAETGGFRFLDGGKFRCAQFLVPVLPVILLALLRAVTAAHAFGAQHHLGQLRRDLFAVIADARDAGIVPEVLVDHRDLDGALALLLELCGIKRTARLFPERKKQLVRGEEVLLQHCLVLGVFALQDGAPLAFGVKPVQGHVLRVFFECCARDAIAWHSFFLESMRRPTQNPKAIAS